MVEKKIKIYKALVYFLITVVIILLYKYNPSIADNSLYPSSLFRELTGFYCPGCGATRALHELLHGNIQSALNLNPLLIIFMPYFIYLFFNTYVFSNKVVIKNHLNNKNIAIIIIIFLIYGCIRNIPIYPFSWLAPS